MSIVRINDTRTQAGIHFDRRDGIGSEMGDAHYHPNHELYLMLEGECKYFIGNSIYEIRGGDLVIIPSRMIHKTVYNGNYRKRLLLNCASSVIPEQVLNKLNGRAHILRDSDINDEVIRLFELIEREYNSQDPFAFTMLKCYVQQLYVIIARSQLTSKVDEVTNNSVSYVLNYINEHYSERITLENMAKACAVSISHLSKTFKAETGLGFADYLSTLRLEKAEAMLREREDMSVTEIAFSCGFNDSNYFSDRFKREFGISPLKFRKSK